MSLIESELGNALTGSVKRKANKTPDLRSAAARVSRGAPEVMVKVTGFGKGTGHVKAHLDYVSRNGKVELENDRGEVFTGKEDVKALFKEWKEDFGDTKRHKNQRDTMHLVLSMPENTPPEAVRSAVRDFAKKTFGKNHEYVFALHTDEPHPHCHVTVKCLGFEGRRLNPRKADLQEWREGFATAMRDQGVEAEATPRFSRGKVKRPEKNVIRHIERGDMTHPPRVSKIRAAAVKEAAAELSAEIRGATPAPEPWKDKIQARQRAARAAWAAAAAVLEQEAPQHRLKPQELRNARPDYDNLDPERTRSLQRAAAVYQSRLEGAGRESPTRPLASLRDVSGRGLVRHPKPPQVLLQANAHDRMGRLGAARLDVRRPGAGDPRDARRATEVASPDSKALAAQIRHFLETLPAVDRLQTARDELKAQLRTQFAKTPERTPVRPAEPASAQRADARKGADHAPPKRGGKDVER